MSDELLVCVDIVIERDSCHKSKVGCRTMHIRILLTKSRDVKWWMKDVEKQPTEGNQVGLNMNRKTKYTGPRTHKANWVGKVDQRTPYLTLARSTNHITLATWHTPTVEEKTHRDSRKTYTMAHARMGPYQRSSQPFSGHLNPISWQRRQYKKPMG